MLRNTLLLAVAVLVAVLVGGPLVLSFEMDNVQQAYVNALADKPDLKVVHSRLSRGWFSSDSRVTLALDPSICPGDSCPRLQIDSRIYHGPLPFGAYARTGLSLKPVQGIAISHIRLVAAPGNPDFKSPLPPLTATTVVGLGGDENIHLNWPAFKATLQTGTVKAHVDSASWEGHYVRDASATELRAHLGLPSLKVTAGNGEDIALEGVKAHVVRKLVTPWITDYGLQLGGLRLSGSLTAGAPRSLQDLRLQLKVDSDQPRGSGLTGSDGSLSVARVSVNGTAYGPALLKYQVKRLNAAVLRRIRDRLRQIDMGHEAPGSELLSLDRIYRENGFALLRSGPSLSVKRLQVTTPSGDVTVSADASVPPMTEPQQAALPNIARHLKAKLTAKVPRPVLLHAIRVALAPAGVQPSQVPQPLAEATLSQLTAEHWLTAPKSGGSRYGFDLSLQGGALTLNGRPAPSWSKWLQLFSGGASALQ